MKLYCIPFEGVEVTRDIAIRNLAKVLSTYVNIEAEQTQDGSLIVEISGMQEDDRIRVRDVLSTVSGVNIIESIGAAA